MPTLIDTVGQQPLEYVYRHLSCERRGYLSLYSYEVGGIPHRFEMIERGNAVVILPVDFEKREVYYIVQPRYLRAFAETEMGGIMVRTADCLGAGARRFNVPKDIVLSHEIPAGMIEPKETPISAAIRELKEETGFEIAETDLDPLPPVYPSNGILTERLWLFIASVTERTPRQKPKGDGNEQITLWKASWNETFDMLAEGMFKSASSGILMRELRIRILQHSEAGPLRGCRKAPY
ncbi:NUDIX hydrolase [Candidatus Uhrbacteria bacterium]|nr:NUDIX hydrolase [Candidatus Uhrbacteria bacterium]